MSGLSPELAELAQELERQQWAFDIYDAEWRLVYVSEELRAMLGTKEEAELGYGRHIAEVLQLPPWERAVVEESRAEIFGRNAPRWIHGTPDGKTTLQRLVRSVYTEALAALEPSSSIAWTFEFGYREADLPPLPIGAVTTRLRDELGTALGMFTVYSARLPPRLLTLLTRGDQPMFERMAELVQPGRHAAAIMFADLQSSGQLSRRLPSAAFFRLIRAITTETDEVVLDQQGLVGKHAGDGVTAFFLASQLGSPSKAVRAAVQAATAMDRLARTALESVAVGSQLLDPDEVKLNVGIHWGSALYMGQIVTGGRLEVTALGDEVNESARIQASARDGNVLASKALLEQLEADDAAELGIVLDALAYRPLSELEGVSDKALRDAGAIPVARLTPN